MIPKKICINKSIKFPIIIATLLCILNRTQTTVCQTIENYDVDQNLNPSYGLDAYPDYNEYEYNVDSTDYETDVITVDTSDEALSPDAGTGIVFRPLFVYRQQQRKQKKRDELVENCIQHLKEKKKVKPPYRNYFYLCKIDNII